VNGFYYKPRADKELIEKYLLVKEERHQEASRHQEEEPYRPVRECVRQSLSENVVRLFERIKNCFKVTKIVRQRPIVKAMLEGDGNRLNRTVHPKDAKVDKRYDQNRPYTKQLLRPLRLFNF
jgi:hypothetical protein